MKQLIVCFSRQLDGSDRRTSQRWTFVTYCETRSYPLNSDLNNGSRQASPHNKHPNHAGRQGRGSRVRRQSDHCVRAAAISPCSRRGRRREAAVVRSRQPSDGQTTAPGDISFSAEFNVYNEAQLSESVEFSADIGRDLL